MSTARPVLDSLAQYAPAADDKVLNETVHSTLRLQGIKLQQK